MRRSLGAGGCQERIPSGRRFRTIEPLGVIVRLVMACLAAAAATGSAVASVETAPGPRAADLTAAQIVDKNAAARGGLDAWRKVQTMIWLGHFQSPHGPMPSVPFTMIQKRPNKTHFEVNVMGEKSLRVFDGVVGWKVRAKGDGSPDLQPFAPQDARFARDGQGIDGPLIDWQAKGNAITLEGLDQIDARTAYRLNVRLPSGQNLHVWVDSQSFLEVRSDRTAFTAAGRPAGTVATYYRDYKIFDGLQIPTIIETGVGSGQGTDQMVIERVVVNSPVDDRAFTRAAAMAGRQRGFVQSPGSTPNQTLAPMASPNASTAPGAPGSTAR